MIDSYFGLIGNSFYAGPNGSSFQIKYVFPNKVALNQDEAGVLSSSPVQVGDFVIISYGDKNTQEYLDNKEIDEALGGYWNATLWQKKFGQPPGAVSDQIYYENIVTFSSAEPTLTLVTDPLVHADTIPSVTLDPESTSFNQIYIASLPTSWNIQAGTGTSINPGETPAVVINQYPTSDTSGEADRDSKYVHFSLPTAWNIGLGDTIILDPGQNPTVATSANATTKIFTFSLPAAWDIQLGNTTILNPGQNPTIDFSQNNTTKTFAFSLPKAWMIGLGDTITLDPGQNPTVAVSTSVDETTKIFTFSLPDAWDVQLGTVTAAAPNTTPVVVINQIDGSGQSSTVSKYLHFTLPVSQVLQGVTVTLLGPAASPSGSYKYAEDDTIKKYPTLDLKLPRASITKYGSSLMQTTNYTINPGTADYGAVSDLAVGDYYINTTLAAVHRIASIDPNNNSITTEYRGTMQLAIPTITANAVNPYDASGNPTTPTITTSTTTSPVNAWNVTVNTPIAPVFVKSNDSGFVASTATGEISSRANGQNVILTLKIPRGTKFTTYIRAADKNTIKSTSLDGDMYLDNIGALYVYSGNGTSGIWESAGSLKGDSFQVKNSSAIVVTANDLLPYSGSFYEKIGAYIDANYSSMMASYKLNEIINVNYQIDTDVYASYWLFKASGGTWTGSQLTGNASNSIIVDDWQSETDDSKAYSVTLINQLRGTIANLQSQITALQAEVDKGWGVMTDNGLVPYDPEE